jgi:hypothetical protein
MDPISIKVTFQDLPIGLKHNIIVFFNILSVFFISMTMFLYFLIFKYLIKMLNKNKIRL